LGCGGGSTQQVIEETRLAKDSGAEFALILVPSYFHFAMTEDAIIAFFEEVRISLYHPCGETFLIFYPQIADASLIPVIIYNFPGVSSGLDCNSEMLEKLGHHPNIVGVKLTCGGIAKVARVRSRFTPETFCALAGQSDWLLPAISCGGIGAITGLANIYPRVCILPDLDFLQSLTNLTQTCIELYNLSISGKTKEAEQAQIELAAVEWGLAKGGINGTKWVVAQYLGYPETSCHTRRPYPRYNDTKKQAWITETMRPLEAKEKNLTKGAGKQ
jgi:4-hydroxy-2-oxoglutarate aldolase